MFHTLEPARVNHCYGKLWLDSTGEGRLTDKSTVASNKNHLLSFIATLGILRAVPFSSITLHQHTIRAWFFEYTLAPLFELVNVEVGRRREVKWAWKVECKIAAGKLKWKFGEAPAGTRWQVLNQEGGGNVCW